MGTGRSGTSLTAAGLNDDDGLLAGSLPCQVDETPAVLEPLDIEGNGGGVIVLCEILYKVLKGQVSLVAGADELAKADSVVIAVLKYLDADVAALGGKADFAFDNIVDEWRGDESGTGADVSHDIRPNDADAVFPGHGKHRRLSGGAFWTGFSEITGYDNGSPHSFFATLVKHLWHERGGYGDEDKVYRTGNIKDAGIAFFTVNFRGADVNGIDLAYGAGGGFLGSAEYLKTPLLVDIAGADDGNRSRVKDCVY